MPTILKLSSSFWARSFKWDSGNSITSERTLFLPLQRSELSGFKKNIRLQPIPPQRWLKSDISQRHCLDNFNPSPPQPVVSSPDPFTRSSLNYLKAFFFLKTILSRTIATGMMTLKFFSVNWTSSYLQKLNLCLPGVIALSFLSVQWRKWRSDVRERKDITLSRLGC